MTTPTTEPLGSDKESNLEAPGPPHRSRLKTLGFVIVATAVVWFMFDFEDNAYALLNSLDAWIENAGAAAPVGATIFTGIWLTLCFPGPMILATITTIFHAQPWTALMIVWMGDTIGEVIGFLVARRVARKRVTDWVGHKKWFKWLEAQVETRGLIGVALIRSMPFFPNSVANYAFGLTSLKFWPYLGASVLGTLPNVGLYVVGTAGIMKLFDRGIGVEDFNVYLALGVLLAALAVAWSFQSLTKKKLVPEPDEVSDRPS